MTYPTKEKSKKRNKGASAVRAERALERVAQQKPRKRRKLENEVPSDVATGATSEASKKKQTLEIRARLREAQRLPTVACRRWYPVKVQTSIFWLLHYLESLLGRRDSELPICV